MPTCPNCAHEFLDAQPNHPPYPPSAEVYNDFAQLEESIIEFAGRTKLKVHSSDDPYNRLIGFQVEGGGRRWCIPLTRVKEQAKSPIYSTYLTTAAGREALAALWYQGRRPEVEFPKVTFTTPS